MFKLKREKLAYATIDNLIQEGDVEVDVDSEEVKTPARSMRSVNYSRDEP